jgi:hypothetical protein
MSQTNTTSNFLGSDYPYQDNIRDPRGIGMNSTGTMPQMGRNIRGFVEYTKLLVTGNSMASVPGGPLGNKYFLKTGAKCRAMDTCKNDETGNPVCEETDRYIYINNIPGGNIPLISSGMGINFSEFRGLVPGSMENLNVLNPMAIFRAFSDGATPPCQEITMQTVDNNNRHGSESHYVTLGDIKSMDPCWFGYTPKYNNTNPVTNRRCRSAFTTLAETAAEVKMSDDPMDQIYYAGLAGLGIYIFYRIMEKAR